MFRVTESTTRSRIVNIQHVKYVGSEILLCGGDTEDKRAFDICRLSRETISNQKAS